MGSFLRATQDRVPRRRLQYATAHSGATGGKAFMRASLTHITPRRVAVIDSRSLRRATDGASEAGLSSEACRGRWWRQRRRTTLQAFANQASGRPRLGDPCDCSGEANCSAAAAAPDRSARGRYPAHHQGERRRRVGPHPGTTANALAHRVKTAMCPAKRSRSGLAASKQVGGAVCRKRAAAGGSRGGLPMGGPRASCADRSPLARRDCLNEAAASGQDRPVAGLSSDGCRHTAWCRSRNGCPAAS